MSGEGFHLSSGAMCATTLFTFIALYFIKAGYGMFCTASWGYSINNKLAWVLMEAPVFVAMSWLWGRSGVGSPAPVYLFFLLFRLYYFQRSLVFPPLLKGKSRMPVTIMAMGIVFDVPNGVMQAGGLFYFAPEGLYAGGWAYLLKPHTLLGALLFFAGMLINLHSDRVIRHLRKPSDTRHYLPVKGPYRYVTLVNYFGESVERIGSAIFAVLPAAWVSVWRTFTSLVPRSDAIYRYYRAESGDEVVGKRKRITPYVH